MLLTVVHSSLATMEADSLWRMVVMNRPASGTVMLTVVLLLSSIQMKAIKT